METVIEFIFLGSKITMDSDYNHEIKSQLFLRTKTLTDLHLHKEMSLLFNMQKSVESKYCFSSSHIWMHMNHKKG